MPSRDRGDAPVWSQLAIRGVTLQVTTQNAGVMRPTGAPAVVAVHGGPGVDGAGLRHILAPLSREVSVVVPDQRGHGRSDRASAATWELDEWADDLAGVIAAMGLVEPVVIGVSFGGWVALRHAVRHPSQVGALVVAATTARLPSLEEGMARMAELGGADAATAWRDAHTDHRWEHSAEFARHCEALLALHRPAEGLIAVRERQIRSPEVNEHFTPRFAQLDLTADVASLTCPFSLVIGKRDPLTTMELVAATANAYRGTARVTVVEDAAHDLLVDAPDEVLSQVRHALTRRRQNRTHQSAGGDFLPSS